MNVRAAVAAVTLLCASAVAVEPVHAHEGVTACVYDAATKTVGLRLSHDHVVRLLVVSGRIEFADLASFQRKGPCGAATTKNTDTIRLTEETAGTSRVQIGVSLGRFGPGATPEESSGGSEIEIYLGTVRSVTFSGSDARDVVRAGTNGIAVNSDADVDIIGTVDDLWVYGNGGNDYISLRGGYGAGDPLASSRAGRIFWASGGDGNDRLYSAIGRTLLDGDSGEDALYGSSGNDESTAATRATRSTPAAAPT